MSSPAPAPLTITILGAGIAGLTAALAFRRQGHRVTLLEKSTFHQETGAAMWVGPNVSALLRRLGLDPGRTGANVCAGISIYAADGRCLTSFGTQEMQRKWENPLMLTHRVDFHRELKRLVLAADGEGEGPVARLELGIRVVGIDPAAATVTLEDGRVFAGDLVVGADGNRSVARRELFPDAALVPWGKTAYRWLLPREVLAEQEDVRELIGAPGYFEDVMDTDRKVVLYPCRDNTIINCVAIVPDSEAEAQGANWNQQGDKARLESIFATFFPALRKVLAAAGADLKVWRLFDLPALSHWTRDRLVLIGDAAHPFMPFLGQGGAMAIEDSTSLAAILSSGTSPADVPELLKLFESARKPRVDYMQQQTRLQGLDEGKGKPPPPVLFEMLDYAHMFNEWEHSSKKREDWEAQKDPSKGHISNISGELQTRMSV